MFERYKKLLTELIGLKSVSALAQCQPELTKTADFFENLFTKNGFKVSRLTNPDCNPVIVAKYDAGHPATTLVYGHYDVQPAELNQGWNSDPFKLVERDGRFFGRGSLDNKGQVLIHIVAVLDLIKTRQLQNNVTFLLEGNEETANPVLDLLIKQNQSLLTCDRIIISDGAMKAGLPTLETSLRGGYNLKISLKTGSNDLHSGLAGGAVPNAARTMTELLNSLSDGDGKVLVPGFYDDMAEIDANVKRANEQLSRRFKVADLGVKELQLANQVDFYTQTGLYPTLQITGLDSGYTGEGFANIVPAKAEARLNVRIVVGQDPLKNAASVQAHLLKNLPSYAEIGFEVAAAHSAVSLNHENDAAEAVINLLEQSYGQKVVFAQVGGAIPVVSDFQSILGIDALLLPLGNEDCNMHGANENFRIDYIKNGLEFSQKLFGSKLPK